MQVSDNIINWTDEADAIIQDVKDHVALICVSKKLESSASEIFLNVRTLENKDFCIRASGSGFQIVAERFDESNYTKPSCDDDDGEVKEEEDNIFETPYALLNTISPRYTKSFANQLRKQLEALETEDD